MYWPVKVGFLYTDVINTVLCFSTRTSRNGREELSSFFFFSNVKRNEVQAFEHLQESMCEEADGVINYFEDTFIGRRADVIEETHYFLFVCGICNRVCDDLPRTINSLEGWHNHLQANISSQIWRFLQVLKTEQALFINQMLAGQEPPSKRKKYVQPKG